MSKFPINKKFLFLDSQKEKIKLFEFFFSIKNHPNKQHKILTIFGVKIKFRINKQKKELKKQIKLIKTLSKKSIKNQKKIIKTLRKKILYRKLRVCFLVSESQKWNAQSLYDYMEKSKYFEPFVLVTRLQDINFRNSYQHNLDYFKNICGNVEIGFNEEKNTSIDIKKFAPDIIFYQQPWDLLENQSAIYASNFALLYYFSYAMGDVVESFKANLNDFYLIMHKYFIFSNLEKKQYKKELKYNFNNLCITGHPKLDIYKDYKEENYERKYVIYAPHHSFEEFSLCFATFKWNGKFILEWAKAHPEFKWVFKPHPRFKVAIIENNIMTKQEIENYYSEWAKIGQIYNDGSYFDLFKNSKCLITDCGSFLTEYLPTKQPVIHLRNPKGINFIDHQKEIMKSYYDSWNLKDLQNYFDEILIKGNDPKKTDRISVMKKLGIDKYSATENIILEIKKDIGL